MMIYKRGGGTTNPNVAPNGVKGIINPIATTPKQAKRTPLLGLLNQNGYRRVPNDKHYKGLR